MIDQTEANFENEKFMRLCFELALRGSGYVSPNPLVGSVIVKNGEIISEGWHEKFGGLHAEVNAINNAKENLDGAALYCNLEPCCHTNKKTPPCVPAIIGSGIKEVFVCNIDPNPEVAGKGIQQLKEAGIKVEEGILKEEGEYLNRFFFKYINTRNPFITLKVAQTVDGFISKREGEQTAITGSEANIFIHKMRAFYDAVLVGANTIRVDDSRLDVRYIEGRNPVRVIVDGNLSIPESSKVIVLPDHHNTWIFTSHNSNKEKVESIRRRGVKVFEMEADQENMIPLKKIFEKLGEEKISSVMVEGGSEIYNQLANQRLVDDSILLQSPKAFGRGVRAMEVDFPREMETFGVEQLGNDVKILLRPKR